MQVGGIGNSGLESHSSTHQVTGCLHDHSVKEKPLGSMGALSSNSSYVSAANAAAEAAKEGFSVVGVLREVVSVGRRFLGRIWDGGDGAAGAGAAINGSNSGEQSAEREQVMAQIGEANLAEQAGLMGNPAGQGQNHQNSANDLSAAPDADVRHNPRVAAAATAVQAPQTNVQNNPYFTTTSDTGKVKETFFQKIRTKFRDVTGQLTQRFTGKNMTESKQQKSKQDLRKHSRYRERDVEIDCVLTDDSYLMDSYDRKGEYSKLTTEMTK